MSDAATPLPDLEAFVEQLGMELQPWQVEVFRMAVSGHPPVLAPSPRWTREAHTLTMLYRMMLGIDAANDGSEDAT